MRRLLPTDRLLLRLPNWLGDFVAAEPAVDALHAALEGERLAALSLVAPERFFTLFGERFPAATFLDPKESWRGHDVALFLDGSARSLGRAWAAGIGERWSLTSGGRRALATTSFAPAREGGRTPLGLGVPGRWPRRLPRPFGAVCAELVGLAGVPVVDRAPRLAAEPAAPETVASRCRGLGVDPQAPFVLLEVGARPDSAKAAPAELWAAVLRELAEAGAPPVLAATAPGEEALGRRLKSLVPELALFDLPPPTLPELLALTEACALFLGTDSGPRHLATAAGRPQVVLHGPTDPRHTADHNERTTILALPVACGPCHEERCPLAAPRTGHCLSELPAEDIAAAVLHRLSSATADPLPTNPIR